MNRILVIEDDASLAELIGLTLRTVGYDVTTAGSARAGLSELNGRGTDLLILDLTLPDRDGLGLLPEIRSKRIPVIILSARDTVRDKVQGLESGADDYLTKPFDPLELIARTRAVLRRAGKVRARLAVADIEIDAEARTVARDGQLVELTRQEFDLLQCLAEHRGIALSRDRLLEIAWGYPYAGTTRTVDVHVQRLREKLGDRLIRTVPGIGYRLEG
jgi:two-component system alkaline phosphatase synthesis response regulator PhoP